MESECGESSSSSSVSINPSFLRDVARRSGFMGAARIKKLRAPNELADTVWTCSLKSLKFRTSNS